MPSYGANVGPCVAAHGSPGSHDMLASASEMHCNVRAGGKDDVEESGWKMVSGDVFRSPKNATLLCVQLGSGVQIILSSFITLFFAALGEARVAHVHQMTL